MASIITGLACVLCSWYVITWIKSWIINEMFNEISKQNQNALISKIMTIATWAALGMFASAIIFIFLTLALFGVI